IWAGYASLTHPTTLARSPCGYHFGGRFSRKLFKRRSREVVRHIPLRPSGGREGPIAQRWEGEVGIGNRSGIPHLTPALSAPGGGEGEKFASSARDPTDIHHGDWVDRWLPGWAEPYARLARLDRPIGTWLLLFPGWWGIALASQRWPDPLLLVLFAIGAVAMRGAGCTLNDIADRDYDGQVARTRLRPLPSGAVSVRQAIIFLLLQLVIGAAVLFSLNRATILLGIAVLVLIGTYPFMKRITYWPQVFLGLNFNWGALIGWTAITDALAWPSALLYLGGIFWTIGYDTIYAHQDKEDDVRIGVKSSAIALGSHTRPWL